MTFKHQPSTVSTFWVLVADRARAQVLAGEWSKPEALEEVASFSHSESRLAGHEILTDGPGRFQKSGGRRASAENENDLPHQMADAFAMEIVDHLEKGRQQNDFGRLVLVAAPRFLGVLRDKLPAPLARTIVREINKDYTNLRAEEILGHLNEAQVFQGPR